MLHLRLGVCFRRTRRSQMARLLSRCRVHFPWRRRKHRKGAGRGPCTPGIREKRRGISPYSPPPRKGLEKPLSRFGRLKMQKCTFGKCLMGFQGGIRGNPPTKQQNSNSDWSTFPKLIPPRREAHRIRALTEEHGHDYFCRVTICLTEGRSARSRCDMNTHRCTQACS